MEDKQNSLICLKYLLLLLVIVNVCYNISDDSQKAAEFMYQQKLLSAEELQNNQFLVPSPRLDTKTQRQ